MILEILAWSSLALAAVPAGLFLSNWRQYRPAPKARRAGRVSVLIPARNEAHQLPATLEAVLRNTGCEFEVIVLDDHSTDGTAECVRGFGMRDGRVRLESAPLLPAGWCGKPHACQVLAGLARHEVLVFLDADVRLAPDSLCRLSAFLETSGAGLVSGVPRQELTCFSAVMLIPLIHFILLCFLPIRAMRASLRPSMSAGCGQLFAVRRGAYFRAGGHAAIRGSLHDGVMLPRIFRRAGFRTELVDATDLAVCRMYGTDREVWRGLGKNAVEGLGAPGTIGPMTLFLLGGQVLPFVLLLCSGGQVPVGVVAGAAAALAWLPRWLGLKRFSQPAAGALLHPVGVGMLVAIQWMALARFCLGKPSRWKGRDYPAAGSIPETI
ncbi:MAG: glycosyltransferase family 2 protein [Verrucomicrobiota bacterium]